MHDLYLAKEIFDAVIKYAKKNKLKKVVKITIALGQIEDHHEIIKPSNLRFNFRILAKNSIAQKARLIIKKIRGPYWSLKEIKGE